MVSNMIDHLKENVQDWESDVEIETYLTRILNKEAFNRTGLIYGIGHAVYTLSDPRAELLKRMAKELAEEKGRMDEYNFLVRLERVAIETIYKYKGRKKTLCANVDFYSGFVYDMIGIPKEIYTPLFAMARIVGWCAHRNEELNFEGRRIIRPAYKCITDPKTYVEIKDR